MTSLELLITIISVVALVSGTYIWKVHINDAASKRDIEYRRHLIDAETERHNAALELASKCATSQYPRVL